MKILSLLPVYYPATQYGGFIFSTHNLNQALVKLGHQVEVYTTNAGNIDAPINKPITLDGVKITYFPHNRFFNILTSTGWHYSPRMARAMKDNLSKFDLVIINVVWNYPTLIAAKQCQKHHIPYVIIPNGALYPQVFHRQYAKKILYYRLFVKKILVNAKAIAYTTQDEFLKTHRYLNVDTKAIIVPNGLELSDFNHLPSRNTLAEKYPMLKNKKIVLYLGRITQGKGLDILVKAFAKLSREEKNIVLLIVGNDQNNYLKKVRKLVKEEKINDLVLFTGMLVSNEKLAAYRASDVFVLPSFGENFGMAPVEAMACGIPIVISDQVGINREIKKEKAGVVVKCDAGSIRRGIKLILKHPRLAQTLTRKAKKMVKDSYNIDRVAKQLIKKIEQA